MFAGRHARFVGTWRVLGIAGSTLILALAMLVIRYGHIRYPYEQANEE